MVLRAIDPANSSDAGHTDIECASFARISDRREYRMPEKLVSDASLPDGAIALYAALDASSPGKRGASGSLVTDAELAVAFGVSTRTIERWRDQLEAAGYCATVAVGRYARKCVGFGPDEQFVMTPALVVRAMLSGEIEPLDYRLWALTTNTRFEYMGITGCWHGVGWFARKLKRKAETIRAAMHRLVAAGLLQIEDFGNGRGRRLVPQFARAVTQKLTEPVRRAARAVYRQAGLLRKPQLATATPPSPGVGSTPSPGVGDRRRSTRAKAQVGTDSHARRGGRYLSVDDRNRGALAHASAGTSDLWRSVRNSLGKRE